MLGISVHCLEDATLPGGPNHTRHIKIQSFKIAYDEPSSLNDRLAKWAILPSQYEMQFLSQKVVKEQVVAHFLAEHPDPRMTKLYEDLSDEIAEVCLTQMSLEGHEWQLFFNGALRTGTRGNIIAGVGVVLISP